MKGEFDDDELVQVVNKIDDFLIQKKEGIFMPSCKQDVLSHALENEEHTRRVRGVGGQITPSQYFHVPRRRKGQNVDPLMIEKQNELLRANKVLKEKQRIQDNKIAEIEAIIKNLINQNEKSEKASCSNKNEGIKIERTDGASDEEIDLSILDNDIQFKISNPKKKKKTMKIMNGTMPMPKRLHITQVYAEKQLKDDDLIQIKLGDEIF